MTLVVGTNCGLVTTAPTEDPAEATNFVMDNNRRAIKVTVGIDPITITEIGWWCDTATEEANFEVGIYSHNAGTNAPNELLEVSKTNAKGITAGWKKKSGLSWNLLANTIYWLANQLDNTTTITRINYKVIYGQRYSYNTSATTLPDTWTATSTTTNYIMAIYGVYIKTPTGNLNIHKGEYAKTRIAQMTKSTKTLINAGVIE